MGRPGDAVSEETPDYLAPTPERGHRGQTRLGRGSRSRASVIKESRPQPAFGSGASRPGMNDGPGRALSPPGAGHRATYCPRIRCACGRGAAAPAPPRPRTLDRAGTVDRRQHEAVAADGVDEGLHLVGDADWPCRRTAAARRFGRAAAPTSRTVIGRAVGLAIPRLEPLQLGLGAIDHQRVGRRSATDRSRGAPTGSPCRPRRHQPVVLLLQLARLGLRCADDRLQRRTGSCIPRVAAELGHPALDVGEVGRLASSARGWIAKIASAYLAAKSRPLADVPACRIAGPFCGERTTLSGPRDLKNARHARCDGP